MVVDIKRSGRRVECERAVFKFADAGYRAVVNGSECEVAVEVVAREFLRDAVIADECEFAAANDADLFGRAPRVDSRVGVHVAESRYRAVVVADNFNAAVAGDFDCVVVDVDAAGKRAADCAA